MVNSCLQISRNQRRSNDDGRGSKVAEVGTRMHTQMNQSRESHVCTAAAALPCTLNYRSFWGGRELPIASSLSLVWPIRSWPLENVYLLYLSFSVESFTLSAHNGCAAVLARVQNMSVVSSRGRSFWQMLALQILFLRAF